ncbi:hypothetical protein ABLN97_05755 [Mycobacterium tuberculosis]
MLLLMAGFYPTCVVFVFGVLGVLLRTSVCRSSAAALSSPRVLQLIFATSSSEVVLPRLITKMKHLAIQHGRRGGADRHCSILTAPLSI